MSSAKGRPRHFEMFKSCRSGRIRYPLAQWETEPIQIYNSSGELGDVTSSLSRWPWWRRSIHQLYLRHHHPPSPAYHIRSSWSIIKLRGDTFSLQKFVKYQIPLLRSTTPAHKRYEKAQVDGELLKAYVPTTPSSYLILTRTFGGGPIFA